MAKTFYYVKATHKGKTIFIQRTRGNKNFTGLFEPDVSCMHTTRNSAVALYNKMHMSSTFNDIRLDSITVN